MKIRRFIRNYWALSIPLLVLIIALLFLFSHRTPHENRAIGMVDAQFIDVAGELPGRLDSLLVAEGDTVQKGQLLAILKTTEINAIKQQARAAIDAAQSQLDLLKKGPRPETLKAATNLYQIAQHQYELAEKTYHRMQRLYKDSVVSGQEKDMMYFKYQAAKKEMETAQLHEQSLKNGSRPEMIQAATAILERAQQGYALTKSIADNARVYAPVSGIVSNLIIHRGEVVAIGYPMMTILKKNSYTVAFNLRQDKMSYFQPGDSVSLKIPGCRPEEVKAVVNHISPALNFANWVPEEHSGQFELRTFTVNFKPLTKVKGLRAGMTASLNLPE